MSTMGYVTTLAGAEDAASLSLDFEKQNYRVMEGGKLVSKQFSEFFSFARSTSGGRYNEKGLYESVPAGQPRFDYDPITKVLKGLLVEEQRTNLAAMSEQLGSWTNYFVASKRSEIVSPSGILNATKVTPSSDPTWHQLRGNVFSVTAGNNYTTSVFAKKGENDIVRVTIENATLFPSNSAGVFNLSTGTVVSGAGANIQDVGNGWYRCSVTSLCAVTGTTIPALGVGSSTSVGDGVSGLHFWGAQVEMGIFATSYIPTEATFTSRASTATYFDKNGVMKLAGVNIPRDNTYEYIDDRLVPVGLMLEASATNRIPRAGETMRISPWSVAGATMTFETGLDGGLTATKMTENAVSTVKELRQQLTIPMTVGAPCTLSVYAKPSGSDRQLRIGFGSNGPITGSAQAVFNLATRTVASVDNVTYNIQKLPDGWARYSITVVPTKAVSASFYFTLLVLGGAGYAGDGVSGCILYGPQIESGSVATSYIKAGGVFTSRASTATYIDSAGIIQTAAVNVARDNAYGYDSGGVLRPIGFLLEGSATNVITKSQVFSGSGAWSKAGTNPPVVVDNTTVAPDGTLTGATVTLTAEPAQDSNVSQQFQTVAGNLYAGSIYVKADSALDVGKQVLLRQAGNSPYLTVTLTDKWQRIERVEAANTTIGVFTIGLRPSLGGSSGTVNVNIWGAQLEAGATITSYIPTTTAATTRAADVYSSTTSTRAADVSTSVAATRVNDSAPILDMTPWYNQIASSFKVEFTPGPIGVGNTNLAFYTRSSLAIANSLTIVRRGPDVTEAAGIISRPDGSVQMTASDKGSVSTGVRIKACISYKLNSAAFATQGKAPILDNTVELPTPDWLFVGNNGSNSQNLNGHIHSLQYYPVRLSDSQTQLLTS